MRYESPRSCTDTLRILKYNMKRHGSKLKYSEVNFWKSCINLFLLPQHIFDEQLPIEIPNETSQSYQKNYYKNSLQKDSFKIENSIAIMRF